MHVMYFLQHICHCVWSGLDAVWICYTYILNVLVLLDSINNSCDVFTTSSKQTNKVTHTIQCNYLSTSIFPEVLLSFIYSSTRPTKYDSKDILSVWYLCRHGQHWVPTNQSRLRVLATFCADWLRKLFSYFRTLSWRIGQKSDISSCKKDTPRA